MNGHTAVGQIPAFSDGHVRFAPKSISQAVRSARRVRQAEGGVREAAESATKNLAGVAQTRGSGGTLALVIRPQEAVASVQALAQAYADYFGAVADSNRAQFRLYRALGQPAQCVVQVQQVPTFAAPAPLPAAAPTAGTGPRP
jgi:hypothetical protein